MGKDLVSAQTRQAFRETLSGSIVLREISGFFDAACVPMGNLPPPGRVSGERRTLVEQYYGAVDWARWDDVRRVLVAYESILIDLASRGSASFGAPESVAREQEKLVRLLKRDGFEWNNDRLTPAASVAVAIPLSNSSPHFDSATLQEHLRRIEDGILQDPGLAIGSAKELVESVAKMVLHHFGQPTDKDRETFSQLVGRALGALDLKAEKINDASVAAEASRKVLGSLAGIAGGMAEIRNAFGTGHGRRHASGITVRHARLMVGSAATLCQFMISTYEERIGDASV